MRLRASMGCEATALYNQISLLNTTIDHALKIFYKRKTCSLKAIQETGRRRQEKSEQYLGEH